MNCIFLADGRSDPAFARQQCKTRWNYCRCWHLLSLYCNCIDSLVISPVFQGNLEIYVKVVSLHCKAVLANSSLMSPSLGCA